MSVWVTDYISASCNIPEENDHQSMQINYSIKADISVSQGTNYMETSAWIKVQGVLDKDQP